VLFVSATKGALVVVCASSDAGAIRLGGGVCSNEAGVIDGSVATGVGSLA
jgi:hypothetical protein